MATRKPATPDDEKLSGQDFDLFDAINRVDRKEYSWYASLTEEQRKKFVPFMMVHWISSLSSSGSTSEYYVRSVDYYANTHMFNDMVQKHPQLQWLMLCAASPGMGKQYHKWIPHLPVKTSQYREPAKLKDIKDYYQKLYPKAAAGDLTAISEAFVTEHKKKCYLAKRFPAMKLADIETLAQLVTDDEIADYERDNGN